MRVTAAIDIPEGELIERFTRADGPGGQHVNRTASAVELRFDVTASPALPDAVRARLLARHDRRLNDAGVLVIRARRFRDQALNRADARERLCTIIRSAMLPPRRRIATRPTRASKERRLTGKKQRAAVKRNRGRPRGDD